MKYVKYGLLGILFVFLLKGIGMIADIQEFTPGSMVVEERGFKTDKNRKFKHSFSQSQCKYYLC